MIIIAFRQHTHLRCMIALPYLVNNVTPNAIVIVACVQLQGIWRSEVEGDTTSSIGCPTPLHGYLALDPGHKNGSITEMLARQIYFLWNGRRFFPTLGFSSALVTSLRISEPILSALCPFAMRDSIQFPTLVLRSSAEPSCRQAKTAQQAHASRARRLAGDMEVAERRCSDRFPGRDAE